MGKFETAKTVSRVVGDLLAGAAGFFLGGPAGAIAAAETADQVISGGFDLGKGIYDSVTETPTRTIPLANVRRVNNTNHIGRILPVHVGNNNNAANRLTTSVGNNNIPLVPLKVPMKDIVPVMQPLSTSRQFSLGGISKEPLINVGIAKGKYVDRDFVSDQNENPNAAFATTGFSKVRNKRRKEKIYRVVI